MKVEIMIKNKEIMVIGDLHLGNNLDSAVYHDIALNYAKWIKDQCTQNGIYDLLFLGDIFHNREEIGTNTLHTAYEFFTILSNFNIIIILGNHDLYYKDKTDITSTSVFRGWNNITIISEKMQHEFGEPTNKSDTIVPLCFCPWGYTTDIPKCSILFGHFELETFKHSSVKLCEHGVKPEYLLSVAPLIFTGHFHERQEREYKNGKIIYVGSVFEQNWGETDTDKGVYILDIVTGEYRFIKNTISPIHIKISLEKLLSNKEVFLKYKDLIPNNFVKLMIDKKIDYTMLEKIINKLSLLQPLDFKTEFVIIDSVEGQQNFECASIDIKEIFQEYLNGFEVEVDKEVLTQKIMTIYEKALSKIVITGD